MNDEWMPIPYQTRQVRHCTFQLQPYLGSPQQQQPTIRDEKSVIHWALDLTFRASEMSCAVQLHANPLD